MLGMFVSLFPIATQASVGFFSARASPFVHSFVLQNSVKPKNKNKQKHNRE
jgi:hypothetical protein